MPICHFVYGDIMPKRITISDEEYFKILELKVKHKTDSLFAILSLVTDNQNAIIDKLPSPDKMPDNQFDIPNNQNVKLDIEPKRQIVKKDITPNNPETIEPERLIDTKNQKSHKM